MLIEVECHSCKKEFDAKQDQRGKCPFCECKYDWYWDGELWGDTETCCIMFDSESEKVKNLFLIGRDYI